MIHRKAFAGLSVFWALAATLAALAAAGPSCPGEHCGIETDVQDLIQTRGRTDQQMPMSGNKDGSTNPAADLETVYVKYSLVDDSGKELFNSHPSLLQALSQQHVGNARTATLRLRFEAFGHKVNVTMQKRRAPLARDIRVTVADDSGHREHYVRDRNIYEGPGAVLTSVGSQLKGLLRRGDTFLDLELPRNGSLLTVRTGRLEKDYRNKVASLLASNSTQPLPEKWEDCFTGDDVTKALGHGIVIGSKLYMRFANEDEAVDYIILLFTEANLIYKPQLNFVLVCKDLHLQKTHNNAPDWDQGPTCRFTIAQQLDKFKVWDPPRSRGLWTLLDDCFDISVGGTIGLAYVGTLCMMHKSWGSWPNVGVVWYSERTWKTFAHEVGHNFGGHHSFENGQGNTGGIMDYGDGTLNGVFQFNTQFRKTEICSTINYIINRCSQIWDFSGECGNRILTDDEDCECDDGSSDCAMCHDCILDTGADCTPEGMGVKSVGLGVASGACCTSNGLFKSHGTACEVPGVDDGFCSAGLCIPARCQTYTFAGTFCGINEHNQCKFKCKDSQTGACNTMDGWLVSGRPANIVLDQIPCKFSEEGDGICMSGECIPAWTGCGNGLKEADEECECADPGTTACKYCTNCKLQAGKQCTPDARDAHCCDASGMYKTAGTLALQSNGFHGFCFAGVVHSTKCEQLAGAYAPTWGDFCGLHEDNPCRIKCMYTGHCDALKGWTLNNEPLNQLPDGTPCEQQKRVGSCTSGQCVLPATTTAQSVTTTAGGGGVDVDMPTGDEGSDTTEGVETTKEATTKAATTKPPTQAPTTAAPPTTTEEPTTEEPTTKKPTTKKPTTAEPTTKKPTTEEPTTTEEEATTAGPCSGIMAVGHFSCQLLHDRSRMSYAAIDATYGSDCTGCQDAKFGSRVQAMQPQQCRRCWRLWMNTCDSVLDKLGRAPDLETCARLQRRNYQEGSCTCNCGKCQRLLSR